MNQMFLNKGEIYYQVSENPVYQELEEVSKPSFLEKFK